MSIKSIRIIKWLVLFPPNTTKFQKNRGCSCPSLVFHFCSSLSEKISHNKKVGADNYSFSLTKNTKKKVVVLMKKWQKVVLMVEGIATVGLITFVGVEAKNQLQKPELLMNITKSQIEQHVGDIALVSPDNADSLIFWDTKAQFLQTFGQKDLDGVIKNHLITVEAMKHSTNTNIITNEFKFYAWSITKDSNPNLSFHQLNEKKPFVFEFGYDNTKFWTSGVFGSINHSFNSTKAVAVVQQQTFAHEVSLDVFKAKFATPTLLSMLERSKSVLVSDKDFLSQSAKTPTGGSSEFVQILMK